MAVNLGVGSKLLLAMTLTISLLLVAAVIGWQGYERVASKQNSVIDEAIPSIIAAHSLTEINASLATAAPALLGVTNEPERKKLTATIEYQLQQLKDSSIWLGGASDYPFESLVLQSMSVNISNNLAQQISLVKYRLAYLQKARLLQQKTLLAMTKIHDISTSLVANANTMTTAVASSLYDLADANTATSPNMGQDALYMAFDRLIEVDLDHMDRMYELRQRSASLMGLLTLLPKQTALPELYKLEQDIQLNMAVLKRRVAEVNDPGRRQQGLDLLSVVEKNITAGIGDDLFTLQRSNINVLGQLLVLNEVSIKLSKAFNEQADNASRAAGKKVQTATDEARTAVANGRNILLMACLILAVVAIGVLWFYVKRNLFRRLTQLNQAFLAVAQGNFDYQLQISGTDELGRLAKTVQVFKENALARQQLEQQQEAVELRLRNYQSELEQEIQVRTRQLQQLNQELLVTAEKHETARTEAERANQAKTAFLATMSHEVRTPLSGVLGTLRLLQKTQLDQQQEKYIGLSQAAAEALLGILNGILDYAKVEQGQMQMEHLPYQLAKVEANMVALMAGAATEKGLKLDVHIPDQLRRQTLVGDQGKVQQVLFNLLGNAIKFTTVGYIELHVSLVDEDGPNERLRFEVRDTGLGMPDDLHLTLFQPFTQYDASTSRRFGGTGLGLSICKTLVAAMEGTIGISNRIENDVKQGSMVWFELPFWPDSELLPLVPNVIAAKAVVASMDILLVEDNDIGRIVVEGYLRHEGHKVTLAKDGFEAVELAERPFDLIFMDISMPGMDGVEATLRMHQVHKRLGLSIPIIAMSAHIFPSEVDSYLNSGMDGFVGKPIDPERLNEILLGVSQAQQRLVSMPHEVAAQLVNEKLLNDDLSVLGQPCMVKMVSLFTTACSDNIIAIHIARQHEEWVKLSDLAHNFKNAAGSLGLETLYQLINQLENQAKHAQPTSIDLILEDLPELVRASQKALNNWSAAHLD
jgi:two-component system sensor histidine kinase TorS